MPVRARGAFAALAILALAVAGCGDRGAGAPFDRDHGHRHEPSFDQAGHEHGLGRETIAGPRSELGLMTSLPLYWPLGAELGALASGKAPIPWQRAAIERRFEIVPLDTLAPIPALEPGAPDQDPLGALERIAIIQPRGLSPTDNVALDRWVREGGELLLVLDPALTGHYDLALGDPRLPSLAALIPPVVERWGMRISFDEAQPAEPTALEFEAARLPLLLSGMIARTPAARDRCTIAALPALARCRIGQGRVTLLADAALLEHRTLAGEEAEAIAALLDLAFTP